MVTLAIGRFVSTSRPHSTWPVAASASTAPLAFTPLGAPVTSIAGWTAGRGVDGEAGTGVRAGTGTRAADVAVGVGTRGPWAGTPGVHAATPPITAVPIRAALAASTTIRPLRRITVLVPTRIQISLRSRPVSPPRMLAPPPATTI